MKDKILRCIPAFLVIIISICKDATDIYDILYATCIFINMLLAFRVNGSDSNSLITYGTWVPFILVAMLLEKFQVDSLILLVLVLKVIVLIICYVRYKRFSVPTTFLSKLWIITLFIYLCELVTNSTHGFKTLFIAVGIISAVESIIIMYILKTWRKNVITVFKI